MQELSDVYRAFESHVAGGSRPDEAELRNLPGSVLRRSDEHDVARLLLLAALGARLRGGGSVTPLLLDLARRYEESSFLYTGRIIPRIREMIELLDTAVDERSVSTLVAIADHFSQGWSAYPGSVFPRTFARLAAGWGATEDVESFTATSFVHWQRGLAAAAANQPKPAREHFARSLDRYRENLYYADVTWLFTDRVIVELLDGRDDEAEQIYDEQCRYVEEVLASHPPLDRERPRLFQLGDVHSGEYRTFVESTTLRPTGLAHADGELLRRYVRTSEFLLDAARYRSARDFDAAVDLFSSGWATFSSSPYPTILEHVAKRFSDPSRPWQVSLTAYARWHRMALLSQVRPKPQTVLETAVELYDRLGRAGLTNHAAIALLDAAVIYSRLFGRASTAEWIGRYMNELRSVIPDLVRAAVDHLQTPTGVVGDGNLPTYLVLRSQLAPDLTAGIPLASRRPGAIDVAIYGRLLSIAGVTVYECLPAALVRVLDALGAEFDRGRERGTDIPLLTASELSARVGCSPAALAQTVRRFRTTVQQAFGVATDMTLDPEAIIQGRPGYRFNPASVERYHRYP
jgi:hypothetical protein